MLFDFNWNKRESILAQICLNHQCPECILAFQISPCTARFPTESRRLLRHSLLFPHLWGEKEKIKKIVNITDTSAWKSLWQTIFNASIFFYLLSIPPSPETTESQYILSQHFQKHLDITFLIMTLRINVFLNKISFICSTLWAKMSVWKQMHKTKCLRVQKWLYWYCMWKEGKVRTHWFLQ